jgi:acetylornithine deacetylase/succinyl-diaminopimelate desuccinylase-like protein
MLSEQIGARQATSREEKKAAEYVRDELIGLGVSNVRLEPFQGATSAWMPWSVALSLAAWGMLIGLLFGLVGGVIAAGLYLFAAWIIYCELHPPRNPTGGYPVRRWLRHRQSQNVLGVARPAGSTEQRVVLMGYLDSARTAFLWRSQRRQRFAGMLAAILFFSLIVSAAALFIGAITTSVEFYFVALFPLLFQIVALFASIRADRGPVSPGANNNASGVGVMLALAERLLETPLTRTEVWLLTTGCRETGGDGLRAVLETHSAALSESTFIALEGVGVGARVVVVTGEGSLRLTRYAAETQALAEQAAERCRADSITVRAARHLGGSTETGIISRSGMKGIAVNVWPDATPGIAGRRNLNDTIDTIQEQALSQALAFAWALLQEIDTPR